RGFFFLHAGDGIRVFHVTGVQTCALPISATTYGQVVGGSLLMASAIATAPRAISSDPPTTCPYVVAGPPRSSPNTSSPHTRPHKIGRASCRARLQSRDDADALPAVLPTQP